MLEVIANGYVFPSTMQDNCLHDPKRSVVTNISIVLQTAILSVELLSCNSPVKAGPTTTRHNLLCMTLEQYTMYTMSRTKVVTDYIGQTMDFANFVPRYKYPRDVTGCTTMYFRVGYPANKVGVRLQRPCSHFFKGCTGLHRQSVVRLVGIFID